MEIDKLIERIDNIIEGAKDFEGLITPVGETFLDCKTKLQELKAMQERDVEVDRAYVNGFRSGYSSGQLGDEVKLKKVTEGRTEAIQKYIKGE